MARRGWAERLAAGVRWRDTGHVRRMFKNVCEAASIGENWMPRELRPSFVSLMSDRGTATEEIARLVGHRSTRTTETVAVDGTGRQYGTTGKPASLSGPPRGSA